MEASEKVNLYQIIFKMEFQQKKKKMKKKKRGKKLPVDDDMFDSVEVFLFLDSHNVIECLLRIFSVVNLARSLATESKKKFSH